MSNGRRRRHAHRPDRVGASRYTPVKLERLERFARRHGRVVRDVLAKPKWADADRRYHYFDFYAGPGTYSEADYPDLVGRHGSPILVPKIIEDTPLTCLTFLSEPWHADRLARNLREAGIDGVTLMPVTCADAIARLIGNEDPHRYVKHRPMGLAFIDPNGPVHAEEWEALERFVAHKRFGLIDVLINVNASIAKFCHSSRVHAETLRTTEHLARLGKKSIQLWNPCPGDPHQFTLAYCTDGPTLEFVEDGFVDITSPCGRDIARRIDYSAKERESLPPDPPTPPPTGPTFLRGIDWR